MTDTSIQFDKVMAECQELFLKKMQDYGAAWRVLRPSSITDQIFIKVSRIRTLQDKKVQMIDDSVQDEFTAIINYAIIGLIQLELGTASSFQDDNHAIHSLYVRLAGEAKSLMEKKNHDYGEAWREMRISSITDLIYQKVLRTKQIEDNKGATLVSEGIEANYFDMINYAVFCLIKFDELENNLEKETAQ